MQRVLFHSTIFGPIHSRRLGTSLGINLTPNDGKVCSFDCAYCEAGLNAQGPGTSGMATRESTRRQLEAKLEAMKSAGENLDVITFSGNGEPTLHPEFPEIIDDVIALRNRYYPSAKVSVLTNSTRIGNERVVEALRRVDNNILKLDSANTATMRLIDRPNDPGFTSERVIEQLQQFAGEGIVQTMLLRGSIDGVAVDNTTEGELQGLIDAYRRIRPRQVMLYSIDRTTPYDTLEKVPADELQAIAQRVADATGLPVSAS